MCEDGTISGKTENQILLRIAKLCVVLLVLLV